MIAIMTNILSMTKGNVAFALLASGPAVLPPPKANATEGLKMTYVANKKTNFTVFLLGKCAYLAYTATFLQ